MIHKGNYEIKVIEANIKVNKDDKKYISLTLKVNSGPYQEHVIFANMVPWIKVNWMNNLNAFFTDEDISTYMLEYTDEDTMWVVSQLIVGEVSMGKVVVTEYHGKTYNQVMPYRKK